MQAERAASNSSSQEANELRTEFLHLKQKIDEEQLLRARADAQVQHLQGQIRMMAAGRPLDSSETLEAELKTAQEAQAQAEEDVHLLEEQLQQAEEDFGRLEERLNRAQDDLEHERKRFGTCPGGLQCLTRSRVKDRDETLKHLEQQITQLKRQSLQFPLQPVPAGSHSGLSQELQSMIASERQQVALQLFTRRSHTCPHSSLLSGPCVRHQVKEEREHRQRLEKQLAEERDLVTNERRQRHEFEQQLRDEQEKRREEQRKGTHSVAAVWAC